MNRGFFLTKEQKLEKRAQRKREKWAALSTPDKDEIRVQEVERARLRRAAFSTPTKEAVKEEDANRHQTQRAELSSPERRALKAQNNEQKARKRAGLQAQQENDELKALRDIFKNVMDEEYKGDEREKCEKFFWWKVSRQRAAKNFYLLSARSFPGEPSKDWPKIQQMIRDEFDALYKGHLVALNEDDSDTEESNNDEDSISDTSQDEESYTIKSHDAEKGPNADLDYGLDESFELMTL